MKLAVDANALLSALLGGAARRVLEDPRVDLHVPGSVLEEVEEYLPGLAARKGVDAELAQVTLAGLPLHRVERADYESKIKAAVMRIGKRDPDDVELLALALALKMPVWSNDDDFEGVGIEWYATAEVLKKLERGND